MANGRNTNISGGLSRRLERGSVLSKPFNLTANGRLELGKSAWGRGCSTSDPYATERNTQSCTVLNVFHVLLNAGGSSGPVMAEVVAGANTSQAEELC